MITYESTKLSENESASNVIEHHLQNEVPLFVKAKKIINLENMYSNEEITKTIVELSRLEKELKKVKQQIIDATYIDIIKYLLNPIDEYFEEEFILQPLVLSKYFLNL